jgi:hypothetical protein
MLLRLFGGVWVADGPIKCVRWKVIGNGTKYCSWHLRLQATFNVRDVVCIVVRSANRLVT